MRDAGEIVANTLTESDADDIGEVSGLLEQIDGEITRFIADGTYDVEPVYQAVALSSRRVIPPSVYRQC
jgi:hypothetical protein